MRTRLIRPQDVESQRKASIVSTKDIEKARPEYAPTGRGGAGNWASANKLATATAKNANITPSLQESKPPDVGHSGRGGVGNYRNGEVGKQEDEVRETELQEMKHQQVVKDVEMGLKEPEKAHLVKERLEYDTLR